MLPGSTIIRLLPIVAICSSMRSVAPLPIDNIVITAATPMMIPSIVSPDRSLLARKALVAIRALERRDFRTQSSVLAGQRARYLSAALVFVPAFRQQIWFSVSTDHQ